MATDKYTIIRQLWQLYAVLLVYALARHYAIEDYFAKDWTCNLQGCTVNKVIELNRQVQAIRNDTAWQADKNVRLDNYTCDSDLNATLHKNMPVYEPLLRHKADIKPLLCSLKSS